MAVQSGFYIPCGFYGIGKGKCCWVQQVTPTVKDGAAAAGGMPSHKVATLDASVAFLALP